MSDMNDLNPDLSLYSEKEKERMLDESDSSVTVRFAAVDESNLLVTVQTHLPREKERDAAINATAVALAFLISKSLRVSPDVAEDIEGKLMIQIGNMIETYRESIGIVYDNKREEVLGQQWN